MIKLRYNTPSYPISIEFFNMAFYQSFLRMTMIPDGEIGTFISKKPALPRCILASY